MLRSIDELRGYGLVAEDGELGRCRDFLFDDVVWAVRYMVADTRKWLPGRKVLVSPIALGDPDCAGRSLPVRLTKDQLRNCPPLEEDQPVSRTYEAEWSRYYGWPYYWVGGGTWGAGHLPGPLYAARMQGGEAETRKRPDPEEATESPGALRSAKEVKRYQIRGTDDEIGHVHDMIVDDDTWVIRYLVVDTRSFFPGGRKVLVSPGWITRVNWGAQALGVALTAQQIKESPTYDPAAPVNREYEARLYDFYGRPKYWVR